MAPREKEPIMSFPEMKYPSYLKGEDRTHYSWFEGRRKDGGAENLWRIHDNLYNLDEFINKHPGGSMWLEMTKGTDITEAFESHHISLAAEKLLPNFFVREAKTPRNSPFTFEVNGFYRTLKRRVQEHLNYKAPPVSWHSYIMVDSLFCLSLVLSVLAARLQSYQIAIISGFLMGLVINTVHNFVHMKDRWRIYYLSVTGFGVKDWRTSHCLSHHLFPNTYYDLESTLIEPIIPFFPRKNKSSFAIGLAYFLFPVLCILMIVDKLVMRTIKQKFDKEDFLVFLPLILMLTFGKLSLYSVWLFVITLFFTSVGFTAIGFTAAHHVPDLFHEGDIPRENKDWGIHQLDSVTDRVEIRRNNFIGALVYGEHTLHHLFPTIDFAFLPNLEPILNKTLKDFNIEMNEQPYAKVFFGTFVQMARRKPIDMNKRKRN